MIGSFKPEKAGGQEGRARDGTQGGSHSQSRSLGLQLVIIPGKEEFLVTPRPDKCSFSLLL